MKDFTLTLPDARAAAAWLARTVPHISDDDTLPMLTCVQLTIGDGHLLAVATDRYTLAVSRLDVPTGYAPRGTFGVPGSWARSVAADYDDPEWHVGTLTLTAGRITFTGADVYGDTGETIGADLAPLADYDGGAWRPGWRAIVAASLDAPADTRPANIAADYLGRFAPCTSIGLTPDGAITLAEGNGALPFTVHVPTDHRPVVLISHDLLGIIAVRRTDGTKREPSPELGDPREAWGPILAAREQVAA